MITLLSLSRCMCCILRILREWVVYYVCGHNMLGIVMTKEECKTKVFVY